MDLTRIAIEKKRITITSLVLVLISGLLAFFQIPRAEDPGFIVRTAMVITPFPGASPRRVDQLVSDKLEKAIEELPQLDYLKSESRTGLSLIHVVVKDQYKEMRPIWDELRRKVDQAASQLPDGVGRPVVNDAFGDVFGVLVALTGEGFTPRELKEIADEARGQLLGIDEVGKVEIGDAQEGRIFVTYDPQTLMSLELTPIQLKDALAKRNIVSPGGRIFTLDEQIVLEPGGSFDDLDALGNTVLRSPASGEVMLLKDLATIRRGYVEPQKSHASYRGEPAIVLAVAMKEGGNIIAMGNDIRDRLDKLHQAYPLGISFDVVYFQPDFVGEKIGDFVVNLLQSVGIVLGVMLLFLGLRTGLVVASLIPMTMVAALLVMNLAGIGLDQMSLASLIIALGMLVDNAVVMSESIMIGMAEGKPGKQAALDAAAELRIPLLTSSLTTAAAFLPIYLAQSTTGEYTAPLFLVVTITLLCSWFLSLTMIPLFCVLFLRVAPADNEALEGWIYGAYRKLLRVCLHHPIGALCLTLVCFTGVMCLFPLVPKLFFPPNDKAVMSIALRLPEGTPLEKTLRVTGELEDFLARLGPDQSAQGSIENWLAFVGHGAPKYQLSYNPEPSADNYAYVLCNTSDRASIDSYLAPAVVEFCTEQFPDAVVKAGPLAQGAPVDAPIQVRVSGNDEQQLFALVKRVKQKLASFPGTCNITDDWGRASKKLAVEIDAVRAKRAGLTSQDVAVSLQTLLSGLTVTEYREGETVIPVVLRAEQADREDFDKLKSHPVQAQALGHTVPLDQVAELDVVFQPAKIKRRNRIETVTIDAHLVPGTTASEVSAEVESYLDGLRRELPLNFGLEQGGERETSARAQTSIAVKLPIAGLIIVLLLVAQFDSIRRPIIILCTIPLGLIGVVLGLLATGLPFGFMALLGLISLAGIVINNAIVLIDRIGIEIDEHGRTPYEAIMEAGQRRLRPILLTTMTTIGGLIPLWLGGGPLFESMAVAILFGLMFATVITLGFVPLGYALLFRVKPEKPKQTN